MSEPEITHEVTRLLKEAGEGNQQAANQLVEVVYGELHRLASYWMRAERPGHVLQTTALVSEAYLRLFGSDTPLQLNDRRHFFAVAAKQMRNILVDGARGEQAKKRSAVKVSLDEACVVSPERRQDLVALDDSLKELAEIDSDASTVVELRFFGGYTDKETAEIMGQSYAKVRRDWDFARAWLYDHLAKS
jgi:RNA polymerase sigma factor (TIGR02999 family)